MHSDSNPQPTPDPSAQEPSGPRRNRRHRVRRVLGWLMLLLLLLVVAIIGAGAWLMMSESGAQNAIAFAQQRSAGAGKDAGNTTATGAGLAVEGIHGTLAGGLRLDRVSFSNPQQQIIASDVQLQWHPSQLLQRNLHLSLLRIARLDIINAVDRTSPPPVLPQSLHLPLTVQLDRVQIDAARLARGPATLATLGGFAFSGGYDGSHYRGKLAQLAIGSADAALPLLGELRGEVTLADSRPYALNGQFSVSSAATLADKKIAANGNATLAGSLENVQAALDVALPQAPSKAPASVKGNFSLRPFTSQPLSATSIAARDIDLSWFQAKAPHTRIDLDVLADANGSGSLRLRNKEAGTLDASALPLTSLALRFSQKDERFMLDAIEAALGSVAQPAGIVRGDGSLENGALNLDMQTARLDLSRIDAHARKTQLSGSAQLQHRGGRDEFRLALAEPLKKKQISIDASGHLTDQQLNLAHLRLRLDDGEVTGSGLLGLAGSKAFSATGVIKNFRPQALGSFAQLPPLLLNGRVEMSGQQLPLLGGRLNFRLDRSVLAGQPLSGEGALRLHDDRLDITQLLLSAGANKLQANGQLQNINPSPQGRKQKSETGQLRFSLDAPRLDQFGRGFSGALRVSGMASGTLSAPLVVASWTAERLTVGSALGLGSASVSTSAPTSASNSAASTTRLQSGSGQFELRIDPKQPYRVGSLTAQAVLSQLEHGIKGATDRVSEVSKQGNKQGGKQANTQGIRSLNASLRYSPSPDAPLQIMVSAEGIADGTRRFDTLDFSAQGSTAAHRIIASARQARQQLTLAAQGGLRFTRGMPDWLGTLEKFDTSGRVQIRLTQAAPLALSAQRQSLERLRIEGDGVLIQVDSFVHDERGIVSRGQLQRLQLAQLLQLSPSPLPLATDMEVDGEWNISLTDALMGTASLRRRSGDVTVTGASPTRLGLRQLQARAEASGNRIAFTLAANGEQLGQVAADATIGLQRSPGRDGKPGGFVLAPDAPVAGNARIDIPSIAWAGGLLSPTLITEGRLQSALRLSGSVNDPSLAGQIDGSALRLFFTELGVDLRQGQLTSSFDDDRLLIKALRFTSDDGSLLLSGPIQFAQGKPAGQLALQATRFRLLNRSDRRLVVSGDSTIALKPGAVTVRGGFTVNSGSVDIGQTELPQLSDDVVIVGREKKSAAPMAADVNVTVSLGEGVLLKGRGLDARIVGDLRLVNQAGEAPQAQGRLSVAKGSFTAYGRELTIEQGGLRFTGAINNPALDILAMRRTPGQEVVAGVSVRGTVLRPRITLVSEPEVPEAEKLSWLVLGHGLNASGGGDLAALQSAASSLLTGSAAAGMQGQLASAFGLDTLSVSRSQDTLQQRIVTLGKQVSSRLYVSYQQGLETAAAALLLRYTLTPRLTVEAEAGNRSVLSLFYNIAFD